MKPILAGVCLMTVLVARDALGQASAYFDVNGATTGYGITDGGSYSWDDPNWAPSTGGAVATANWTSGAFARFYGGSSGNSYTVTANSPELMSGLYLNAAGVTVNINAAGSGSLSISNGLQGFLVGSGESMVINAPVTGEGGLAPELTGSLSLFGNNTYSGGTTLGFSGSTLTYINNNNSFGSGDVTLARTSGNFAAILATGGSTITLANNFVNSGNGGGVNFATSANTPVVSTGNWSLGANSLLVRNNGDSTSPLTISGVISGTAGITFSGNNGGKITLKGANTYKGATTVNFATAPGTLVLGAPGAIAASTNLILIGGTLDLGGYNQAMGSTALTLAAGSGTTVIDFGGISSLSVSNSASLSWTGTLDLMNWLAGTTQFQIGTDASGLTSGQLAEIENNGNAATLGFATLDSSGYIVFVPEPSSLSLGLGGGLLALGLMRKMRKAG